MTPNLYEDKAREEKCRKFVAYILRETCDRAKNATEGHWRNTALAAGIGIPSETSRKRIIELLEGIKVGI